MITLSALSAAICRALAANHVLTRQSKEIENQRNAEKEKRKAVALENLSLMVSQAEEQRRYALALDAQSRAEKQRQREATEAAWREELARRERDRLDEDGTIAAARADREIERENQRLADMTAALIRQTK